MKPIHWINSTGGDFADGADWSGGVVPGAGEDALIDAPGTYTVTLSSAEAVGSLVLNDAGATVSLGAGADLTVGSSLTLRAGHFSLGFGATISGGTLRDNGGKFLWKGGTLDGVTYDGPFNMKHGALFIGPGGLVLTGADGTGPGTANLIRSSLVFVGVQTLDNATINLSVAPLYADSRVSGSLTLGTKLTINNPGGFGRLSGSTIINEGAINADSNALIFIVDCTVFTNQGTTTVSNGGALHLYAAQFTNLAGGILTGGAYEIDAGSTLELGQDETVAADDAFITLSGAGSVIQSQNSAHQEVSIESTLTTIGASGTLELLAGRDWASAQTMTNEGTLVLGGGTFAAASLTNDGLIRGRGKINVAITDSGTIEAANGTLDLRQAVTGAGALQINAKAILKVEASAAASLTAIFNGVGGNLMLGDAAGFAATIAGFAAGDTIDLLGLTATSAMLQAGDQLVVKNGSQTVATLQLSGDYSGSSFSVASDGRGGSNITVTAGLFAQAISSMAAAPAGQTGHSPETWRQTSPMLAKPRAMIA